MGLGEALKTNKHKQLTYSKICHPDKYMWNRFTLTHGYVRGCHSIPTKKAFSKPPLFINTRWHHSHNAAPLCGFSSKPAICQFQLLKEKNLEILISNYSLWSLVNTMKLTTKVNLLRQVQLSSKDLKTQVQCLQWFHFSFCSLKRWEPTTHITQICENGKLPGGLFKSPPFKSLLSCECRIFALYFSVCSPLMFSDMFYWF